jgi:polysaccharide export outer membrane protein
MLRTPKKYEFDKIEEKLSQIEYKIDMNDQLSFQLYTNNGFQLIDMFGETNGANNRQNQMMMNGGGGASYLIRQDSLVEFPIIGNINLVGKTTREAELYLEKIFSEFYVDPFIFLRVNSKRIFLFNGNTGGEASVIPLTFNNMTLFEVLATAGGISQNNSSKKIRIIRKTKEGIKILNADLSKIEGIKQGNMIMQSHDIIYITPNINILPEILSDINPILSFFSTISLIIFSLSQLNI